MDREARVALTPTGRAWIERFSYKPRKIVFRFTCCDLCRREHRSRFMAWLSHYFNFRHRQELCDQMVVNRLEELIEGA